MLPKVWLFVTGTITASLNVSTNQSIANGPNKFLAESVGSSTYLNNIKKPVSLNSGTIDVVSDDILLIVYNTGNGSHLV